MKSPQSSETKRLRQSVPAWARPGLVMLSREEKRPIEKAFTTEAAQRYEDDEWDEAERMEMLGRHLKKGGNIGWVPHPKVVVIDADNQLGVSWVKNRCPDDTPRMQRKPDRQHFYFRSDPNLRLWKKGVQVDLERGVGKLDIVTPGNPDPTIPAGGQCVVPPSIHADGDPYKWARSLPDSVDDLPMLPGKIADELRVHFNTRKPKQREKDSRHLKSLKHQRRLAIEADGDTPENRALIREASIEYLEEIYQGDRVRIEAETLDIDRQLEGAYGLEGAFQGFIRDGTAESVALEIKSLVEGGLVYVVEEKGWREWNNVVWERVPSERVKKIIGDFYKEYMADAAIEEDKAHWELLVKVARRLKGATFVREIYERMQANLHCSLEVFDKRPELTTFPDDVERGIGAVTYNSRTGEITDPDPTHMMTLMMGAPLVLEARHPMVDRWWQTSFPVKETRDSVQMHAGMSLLGWIPEERIYFMHGSGASGKGTFANVTMLCMGGYGDECDPSTWSGDGGIDGSRNAPDLARLRGVRFVFIDEIASTRRLGARAKALSQDGFITAAAKYHAPSRFPITWSPWIAGNSRPRIDSTDNGLLRRIVEIPMNGGSETPENPDWTVKDTLKRDKDALIAWTAMLVRGLEMAREHGFRPPISEEMKSATAEWIESADLIGDWWIQCCELTGDPKDEVSAGALMSHYEGWMDSTYGFRSRGDIPRANKMQFAASLRTRGLEKTRRGGTVRYLGVRLVEDQETGEDVSCLPKLN